MVAAGLLLLLTTAGCATASKKLMNVGLESIGIKMLGMEKTMQQIQGAVSEVKDMGSFVKDQHKDFTSGIKKAVTSRYNSMTDKMDDHALEGFLARALPALATEDIGNNTCIEGLIAHKFNDGTLQLTNLRVVKRSAMKLLPAIKQDLDARLQVAVSFKFGRLRLVADFHYVPDNIDGRKRDGVITMSLSAPNMVNLNVTVDRSRNAVEALVAQKQCFLTVEALEVKTGEELRTEDVHYESFFKGLSRLTGGSGYTEQFVRVMIGDMRPTILEDLRNALKRMVSSVTNDPAVFCPGELTRPEPMDCAKVRDLGVYNLPQ